METHKKITVTGVLSEGIGLGIKNAVSMGSPYIPCIILL